MSEVSLVPVQWQASGTNSMVVSLEGVQIVGFYTTAGLQSTSLTFLASMNRDGSNLFGITNPGFVTVKGATGGSALSFTVAASAYYGFTADLINQFRGVKHLKVAGGSSENVGIPVVLAVRQVD